MGRYSQDPNEQKWDRHAPRIPFVNKEMQSTTFAWNADKVDWQIRNPTFISAMEIVDWQNTQSSVIVMMQAEDGYTYRVPFGELVKVLEQSQVIQDKIPRHLWRLSKQGSSYITKLEKIL